jgi:LCP family protein required for cell wall assembly
VVNVSVRSVLPPELDPRGPRSRKRRRPPGLRLVNVIAITLSVIILIVSVGGYVVESWFNGSIARIHLNLGKNRPAGAPSGSENWLLVGTDNAAPGEFGDRAGERSDTTILTHLDGDGTTTNVSFPRDTLVTIPSYTDSSGVAHPSRKDKFNTAISLGGPSLLVRTVEQLTGIRVDHYVSVNLDGFKKISQAINGVSICILPSDYHDPSDVNITNINDGFSGFHGKDGVQTLVGDQALAFVRQRHGLVNGDIGRIQRQQQFLGSVFRTATSNRFLFNPDAVLRLLSAIKSALTLDQDTSLTDLEKLGLRLRGLEPGKVTFETIPQRGLETTDTNLGQIFIDSAGGPELIPSGQTASVGNVQILDQTGFDAMIAKLKDQKPPATPKASAPAKPKVAKLTVPPAQVVVAVQNGTGRTGLAVQVKQALAQEGFATGSAATATTHPLTSEVHYAPGSEDSARTAAAAIPGAVLKEDSSVTDGVVLILGANYTTVVPVDMSNAVAVNPAPTPSASVTPTAPAITAASAGNRCTY